MYSRAQRGLWLNYSRRKYFDRNGSGASSTAAFIITSCSWLLLANDTLALTQFGSMERHYEDYYCSHIQIYLSGLRKWSLAVQPSTWYALLEATMTVLSCSVEPKIISEFFFAAYVSKDHWLKQTIETDKSTSVNDHVLDKPLILLSQLEFQQGLIIS